MCGLNNKINVKGKCKFNVVYLCRMSKVETQVVRGVARTSHQSSTKGDLGESGEGILTSQSN